MREIRTVGVVGSGTMGSGIAQVFAQAGYSVRLHDASAPALDRARAGIDRSLAKFVQKGTLTAEARDTAAARLAFLTGLDGFAEVDCVVEAIVEDAPAKRELFERLDAIVPAGRLLTSNTSSISITTLGASTARPELVLGMHFMNPVPLMPLVELIRGQATMRRQWRPPGRSVMPWARRRSKRPITRGSSPTASSCR